MNNKPSTQLCACGCGNPSPVAARNNTKLGHIKGQPIRFIVGHHNKVRTLRPAADRFWTKVIKRGPDECWDWTGSHDQHGYGQIRIAGHNVKTHRFSYELHHGPIPDGADILHKCDRPPCTNPKHLFAGTAKDNMDDAKNKGRTIPPPRNNVKGQHNGHATFTDEQVIALRHEFASLNISYGTFAEMHSTNKSTMYMLLSGHSWKHLPLPDRKDHARVRSGHSTFTNEQVREFRRLFPESNLSVTAFATFHDVPVNTMWNLLRYKTYKDA